MFLFILSFMGFSMDDGNVPEEEYPLAVQPQDEGSVHTQVEPLSPEDGYPDGEADPGFVGVGDEDPDRSPSTIYPSEDGGSYEEKIEELPNVE